MRDPEVERQNLRRTYSIVLGNCDEIQGLLEESKRPEIYLPLMTVGNEAQVDELLDEVDRLLHNYLASLYALCQHLDKSKADASLRKAARKALRDPAVAFALHVRRISSHERAPLAVANLTASRASLSDNFSVSFGPVLIRKDLSDSRVPMDDRARAYLAKASADRDLPVLHMVEMSGAAVRASATGFGLSPSPSPGT